MTLINDELLKLLLESLHAVLPPNFTGSVDISLHYHNGTPGTATAGFKEGERVKDNLKPQ